MKLRMQNWVSYSFLSTNYNKVGYEFRVWECIIIFHCTIFASGSVIIMGACVLVSVRFVRTWRALVVANLRQQKLQYYLFARLHSLRPVSLKTHVVACAVPDGSRSPRSFETSAATQRTSKHNISEYLNLNLQFLSLLKHLCLYIYIYRVIKKSLCTIITTHVFLA
jgi:hypothetical protein